MDENSPGFKEAKEKLLLLIEEISEDIYCSRWNHEIEYQIWGAINDIPMGMGFLSIAFGGQADRLRELSEKIGGWLCSDDDYTDDLASFITLEEWKPRFKAWCKRNQNWLGKTRKKEGSLYKTMRTLLPKTNVVVSENTHEFEEALEKIFQKYMAMPKDEFRAMLEAHKDGDIAVMLQETGALDIWREQMTNRAIDQEIKANYDAFMKKLPELLIAHRGKFALMHATEIVKFFDSAGDAYSCGLRQYPDGFFSIQGVTDIPVYIGAGVMPVTVKVAREAIARAFKEDPGFRRAYVDNVACVLMDRLGIEDSDVRDPVADEIVQMLFEKEQTQ